MNTPKDFMGCEIKPGDDLVYPVRRGSKMWLNCIRVTKAEENKVYGLNSNGRTVQLTNLKNTIVT